MNEELYKFMKNLTVLFVEDEDDARRMGEQVLGMLFKTVYTAQNGQEGLELFRANRPDIVITDIQMPVMNGLEMIKEIRDIDKETPTVVMTAFSDEKYLLESIKLGVHRYVLKPIVKQEYLEALYEVTQRVVDRENAKEWAKQQLLEKINQAAQNIVTALSDAYPNPILVASDDKPVFINDAFKRAMPPLILEQLYSQELTMRQLIENRGNCSYSHGDFAQDMQKLCIKVSRGRKIYTVDQKELFLDGEAGMCTLYTLTDITLLEYQRIKLKNGYERLRELFISRQKASMNHKPCQQEANEECKETLLLISDEEREVLRRSHTHKISAVEYINEIGDDLLDELHDLGETEKEMDYALLVFETKANMQSLEKFLSYLKHYIQQLKRLIEFSDLVFALESMHAFLSTLTDECLDATNAHALKIYLSSIRNDLASWRKAVFEDRTTDDIHYLDNSLFGSCLQIQMEMCQTGAVDFSGEQDIFF